MASQSILFLTCENMFQETQKLESHPQSHGPEPSNEQFLFQPPAHVQNLGWGGFPTDDHPRYYRAWGGITANNRQVVTAKPH